MKSISVTKYLNWIVLYLLFHIKIVNKIGTKTKVETKTGNTIILLSPYPSYLSSRFLLSIAPLLPFFLFYFPLFYPCRALAIRYAYTSQRSPPKASLPLLHPRALHIVAFLYSSPCPAQHTLASPQPPFHLWKPPCCRRCALLRITTRIVPRWHGIVGLSGDESQQVYSHNLGLGIAERYVWFWKTFLVQLGPISSGLESWNMKGNWKS